VLPATMTIMDRRILRPDVHRDTLNARLAVMSVQAIGHNVVTGINAGRIGKKMDGQRGTIACQ